MPYNPNTPLHPNTIKELSMALRERQSAWTKWTSHNEHGRNCGFYSCALCKKVDFVAGERYDTMICWYCMFPDLAAEGKLSAIDERKRQRESEKRHNADQPRLVKRGPVDPVRSTK